MRVHTRRLVAGTVRFVLWLVYFFIWSQEQYTRGARIIWGDKSPIQISLNSWDKSRGPAKFCPRDKIFLRKWVVLWESQARRNMLQGLVPSCMPTFTEMILNRIPYKHYFVPCLHLFQNIGQKFQRYFLFMLLKSFPQYTVCHKYSRKMTPRLQFPVLIGMICGLLTQQYLAVNAEQQATQSNSAVKQFHGEVFCDVVSSRIHPQTWLKAEAIYERQAGYIRKIPVLLNDITPSNSLCYVKSFLTFVILNSRVFSSDQTLHVTCVCTAHAWGLFPPFELWANQIVP